MKTTIENESVAIRIIKESSSNPVLRAALCAFLLTISGDDEEVETILDEVEAEAIRKAYMRTIELSAEMMDKGFEKERMDMMVEILGKRVSA